MNFSTQEMIDMIYVLGASDKNCLLAARIYHQRFPERRTPTKQSFAAVMERFDRTASVEYEKHERIKPVVDADNELNVLLSIREDPHISSRNMSRYLELGRTSIQNILKKHKMHPYHLQLLQELNNNDFERRISFCQWAQQQIHENASFFDYVLFCDEATFHRNGNVNRHNFHYYATENPHFIRTHSQTRWSLNVWGGIVGDYIIGPYFFEGRVNGQIYLEFLENELQQLLEDVPLNIRQQMWLLHDGAPVHHTQQVIAYLNDRFPERWIGRGGPVNWPPRSPDLTKIDFFLWGYIKNMVYSEPPTTKNDMKQRIRRAFQNISVDILQNVARSFEDRLQFCIEANGGHFEQYL